MKIQVKQFAKKKIEALVKKDMQEWPPGCAVNEICRKRRCCGDNK